jgi:hypothetical protein
MILQTAPDNIAAMILFRKAGYMAAETNGDRLTLTKKIRFG